MGDIPLRKHLGSLSYTAYAGHSPEDKYGGFRDVNLQQGRERTAGSTWIAGGDLRWNNPAPGLTVGASWMHESSVGGGTVLARRTPYTFTEETQTSIVYADYMLGNLHLSGEFSRNPRTIHFAGIPRFSLLQQDTLAWYTSVAYRISKHLELGSYHSRFISDTNKDWSDRSNHIYDQTVTARVDINRHWNFKVEGHFIDGYGSSNSSHGFYLAQNPHGFQPKTSLLVRATVSGSISIGRLQMKRDLRVLLKHLHGALPQQLRQPLVRDATRAEATADAGQKSENLAGEAL